MKRVPVRDGRCMICGRSPVVGPDGIPHTHPGYQAVLWLWDSHWSWKILLGLSGVTLTFFVAALLTLLFTLVGGTS